MKQDLLHTAEENSPYWGIKPTDRFLFLDGVSNYVDLGTNVAGQLWGYWLNHAKDWTMAFTIKNYYHPFYNALFWLTEGAANINDNRPLRKCIWLSPGYCLTTDAGTFITNSSNNYLSADLYQSTNLTGLMQYVYTFKSAGKLLELYINGQKLSKVNAFFNFWNNHTATSFDTSLVTLAQASAGLPVSQSFMRVDLGQFLFANTFVNNPKDILDFYHARFDRSKYPAIIKDYRLVDLNINNQTPSSGLVIPDLMGNCTATIVNQITPDYRLYY